MKKVLIINGPNLNMLGKRPMEHYGSLTLDEINQKIIEENDGFFELEFFQTNCEGQMITKLQEAISYAGILINPASFTHTSIGIRDALEMCSGIKLEIHLSKVDEREPFRRINLVRDVCDQCFQGKKENSYLEALRYLKRML
ncbi:MAG: 3-dehydroquinate dehydratase [Roseburia sp.]|nr:3-dehydroquinate dehydratase [Anaeroplasma bactoclasticum]MCM1196476.1 3-dehydroquinate dehydratase [Roseburia sp.]MCM1556511.1 3-dehydroquinate dehydratase [Anaeroplasma bactoclasticum]